MQTVPWETAMRRLSIDNILSASNIEAAIRQVKKGTVPAEDGYDTTFYATPAIRPRMVTHLRALYQSVAHG